MGLDVTISVSGEKEISRRLDADISAIEDLRPAWKDVVKSIQAFQKQVFMGKGAAGGLNPWKPLKASTIKQKRKIAGRFANYPLIRTKKLMNAWTKDEAVGGVRIFEKKYMAYGIDESEIKYAAYHQKGTRKMAARRHLRIPKKLRTWVQKAIQLHLVKTGQLVRQTRRKSSTVFR